MRRGPRDAARIVGHGWTTLSQDYMVVGSGVESILRDWSTY